MTNSDLRKTNEAYERKRKRIAAYRQRTKPVRDRVRLLALLTPLVRSGLVQR
jgi:hypothetical protein